MLIVGLRLLSSVNLLLCTHTHIATGNPCVTVYCRAMNDTLSTFIHQRQKYRLSSTVNRISLILPSTNVSPPSPYICRFVCGPCLSESRLLHQRRLCGCPGPFKRWRKMSGWSFSRGKCLEGTCSGEDMSVCRRAQVHVLGYIDYCPTTIRKQQLFSVSHCFVTTCIPLINWEYRNVGNDDPSAHLISIKRLNVVLKRIYSVHLYCA